MAKRDLPLEKDLQDKFLKKLREIPGVWAYKANDNYTAGIPDILACVVGLFFTFELKRSLHGSRYQPSPIQAHTMRKIQACSGMTFVVGPENQEEVLEFVRKIARKHVKNPL